MANSKYFNDSSGAKIPASTKTHDKQELSTEKEVIFIPAMSQFLQELKEKREVILSNQKQGQLSPKESSNYVIYYEANGVNQGFNKVSKPPQFRESEV